YLADKPEYLVLLPTAAGGALWRLLLGQGEAYDWRILIAGVMVFLIAVGWAVFLARDGIVTQLVQLDSAGGKVRKRANRHGLTGRFGSRLAKGPMERAGWNFFLAMCSSDRVFKGRCLPLAATMIVPLAVLGLGDTGPELAPVLLPYVPYYLLLIVPLIWQVARFSEAYSGNWILRDMSHESLEGFTRGAMKASYIRFAILPIFLIGLLSVMSLDMRGILGFLLSASLTLAVCSWLLTVNGIEAPFTRKYTQAAGTNQMTVGLIAGSVAGVWGFMQYQLFSRLFYAPVLIIPAMGFAWFMWKRLNHASLPIRDGRR
ncbi:MAG: ABC-2 type transport system permease protein, partial [Planctomycetota bacterium]